MNLEKAQLRGLFFGYLIVGVRTVKKSLESGHTINQVTRLTILRLQSR